MNSDYISSLSSVMFCLVTIVFCLFMNFSLILFFTPFLTIFYFCREYQKGTQPSLLTLIISQKMDPLTVPHSPSLIYYPTIQITKSLIHFSFLTYRLVRLGRLYMFKSNPLAKMILNYIPNLVVYH